MYKYSQLTVDKYPSTELAIRKSADLCHHPCELRQEEVVQEEGHDDAAVVTVVRLNVHDVAGAQVRIDNVAHL